MVAALGSRGPLETYTIESQQTGLQSWTDVAKVTFAFVDDYRDAIRVSCLPFFLHEHPPSAAFM